MKINTKAQFYRLWRAGVLGNRPRTWETRKQLARSGFNGTVSMRSLKAGGKTHYRLPVTYALAASLTEGDVTFNESAPDEVLTLQGEVMRSKDGLYLRYSRIPNMKMKEAMRLARDACGLTAKALLDHFMWPSSRDDLEDIFELYPDSVVEFSCYDKKLGDQPHRNTLFWEIRNY